jgi:hypothetical protein
LIEIGLVELNRFPYVFSKARLFLKIGNLKYIENESLNKYPSDFNEKEYELLVKGCKQIMDGIGLIPERPFTNLGVYGFSILFRMFHFSSIGRKTNFNFELDGRNGILDCITFEHIDGGFVTYYNFCEYILNPD